MINAHCAKAVRPSLLPRWVIRPVCSISFDFDTRGTIPK
jgi:hypothetical protein